MAAREPPFGFVAALRLWAPTGLSTFILVAELPVLAALAARSTDGTTALAAFGVVASAIVVFNAASLALASVTTIAAGTYCKASTVRRYCGVVGAVAGLLAVVSTFPFDGTSLYSHVLSLPAGIASAAATAIAVLAPSCVAVALRRFNQGILIRAEYTGPIPRAALLRLVVSIVVAAALIATSELPGAVCGAAGLLFGAVAETVSLHRAVLRHAAGSLNGPPERSGGLQVVVRTHLPLAVTTLVTMAPQVLVLRIIAVAGDAPVALAAWPIVYGAFNLLATPTQEFETITAARRVDERSALAAVLLAAVVVGGVGSAAMALLAWTPVGTGYFTVLNGVSLTVAAAGTSALAIGVLLPFVYVLRAYTRGRIAGQLRTAQLHVANAVGFGLLAVAVFAATRAADFAGASVGMLVLGIAMLGELAVLAVAVARTNARVVDRAPGT